MDSFEERNKETEQTKTSDSQIKRDHVGFFIFLVLLLLAPGIEVSRLFPQMGLERSTLSLGSIGLVIWVLISPHHITRVDVGVLWADSLLLVGFGFYAFLISLISMKFVSIAYALQYLFYIVTGYLLLSAYLKQVVNKGQLKIAFNIIASVFTVYCIGTLISVFTGPIYSFQTSSFTRTWGGVSFNQAVGFSDSPNGAGAMLIIINSFFWFAYRHKGKFCVILAVMSLFSLLLTFSRGAIFSCIIAVAILSFLLILKLLMKANRTKKELRIVIGVSSVFIVSIFFILMVVTVPQLGYFRSLLLGFGVTGSGIIDTNLLTRVDLWTSGIRKYVSGDLIEQVIGNGFRNTEYVDLVGNWITPHNFYVNCLGDFGILGTILFVLSFIIALIRAFSTILKSYDIEVFEFSFVAVASLLIMNMTEVFFYSPTLIVMVLLITLLQSAFILSRRKNDIQLEDLGK